MSSDDAYSSEEEDDQDADLDEMGNISFQKYIYFWYDNFFFNFCYVFFLTFLGKSLETLLSNKKSSSQFLMEREEKERKNLQKMISEGNVSKNKHDEKQEEEEDGPPKVLRITRTFRLVEFDLFMESSIQGLS